MINTILLHDQSILYPRYCSPGVLFFDMGFGWGSIQKVNFLRQKWGFIKENPQKLDFSITWGSIQEWGNNIADTVFYLCITTKIFTLLFKIKFL